MVSKTDRKRSDASLAAFHNYYSRPTLWTAQRWEGQLFPALSRPVRHVVLRNHFALDAGLRSALQPLKLPVFTSNAHDRHEFLHSLVGLPTLSTPATHQPKQDATTAVLQPCPADTTTQLLSHYNLDAASLIPVLLLRPDPSDKILDMCASPGGKSVALGMNLFSAEDVGVLHSNESDPVRFKRLARNLRLFFPPRLISGGSIRAVNLDAASAAFTSKLPAAVGGDGNGYDKVLLDAPCSSERHVIHAHLAAGKAGKVSDELINFRTGTAGKRAMTRLQGDLLLNALRCCKVGGRVVYSTCSVDRLENEDVVTGVLAKVSKGKEGFGAVVEDMDALLSGLDEWSEKCHVGRICLPDHPGHEGAGWGPLYFCTLRKMAT